MRVIAHFRGRLHRDERGSILLFVIGFVPVAFAMAAFMLSLGGIPPTMGFMGKLLIFRSAVDTGLIGLAIVGVLSSAAGVYYYLRVVVYMFMRPVPENAHALERNWVTELTLVLSTAAVVVLGILPGSITEWLTQAGSLFGSP